MNHGYYIRKGGSGLNRWCLVGTHRTADGGLEMVLELVGLEDCAILTIPVSELSANYLFIDRPTNA